MFYWKVSKNFQSSKFFEKLILKFKQLFFKVYQRMSLVGKWEIAEKWVVAASDAAAR